MTDPTDRLSPGLPRRTAWHGPDSPATGGQEDRAAAGLCAVALLAVVAGQWLTTAVALDSAGRLHLTSHRLPPPAGALGTWLTYSVAVLFLVAGYCATRSQQASAARGEPHRRWVGRRLARAGRQVGILFGLWALTSAALLVAGVAPATVRTLVLLAVHPLVTLLGWALLTLLTPWVRGLHPLWPLAVVLHIDLLRFGFHGPAWLGWVNVVAGAMVPYCLGAAWARGGLRARGAGVAWLVGGASATVVLVASAGGPDATAVVGGSPVHGGGPPTLVAVTCGLAQCGMALLLRDAFRRWLRRPVLWSGAVLVSASAVTAFLWQWIVLLAVTAPGLLAGAPRSGARTGVDGIGWWAARPVWILVLALLPGLCVAALRLRRGSLTGSRPARGRNRCVGGRVEL